MPASFGRSDDLVGLFATWTGITQIWHGHDPARPDATAALILFCLVVVALPKPGRPRLAPDIATAALVCGMAIALASLAAHRDDPPHLSRLASVPSLKFLYEYIGRKEAQKSQNQAMDTRVAGPSLRLLCLFAAILRPYLLS